MVETSKVAKKAAPRAKKSSSLFSQEERDAMREYVQEKKGGKAGKADGEAACQAAIAKMTGSDRQMAERLHAIIREIAPSLEPKTWYGMPAYARGGQTICFFQNASKFKARYATLGFTDKAKLDDGSMWPSSFALTEITAADEKKIRSLLKKAVG